MRAIPIFLIFAVLLAISIDSAQGWGRWRFRGRRISSWIRKGIGCKLEAVEQEEADTVDVPFDNVFVDYDDNEDDLIDFEEFYLTMTNNIPIANPALLGETFMAADANNDGSLDQDEFYNAPLNFGDAD